MKRMQKAERDFIASIIAYDMAEAGFTPQERERMADVFAGYIRVKVAVPEFYRNCKRESERAA